jgi:hypothetical protein
MNIFLRIGQFLEKKPTLLRVDTLEADVALLKNAVAELKERQSKTEVFTGIKRASEAAKNPRQLHNLWND